MVPSGLKGFTFGGSRLRPAATCALAAAALWPVLEGVGGVLVGRHGPFQTVWLRYASHLALALAFFLPSRGRRIFLTRRPVLQLLRGLLMFVMPAAFLAGAGSASVNDVWAVVWSFPLLVLAAAPLVLREPVSRRGWTGGGIALLGGVLLLGAGPGILAALPFGMIAAGALAGYILISRILREEDLATSLVYTAIGALLPVTLLLPGAWSPLRMADLLPLILVGTLSLLLLGYLDHAAKHAQAAFVAPILFLALPAEAVLHALRTGSPPGAIEVGGTALVLMGLGATLLTVRRGARPVTAEGSR